MGLLLPRKQLDLFFLLLLLTTNENPRYYIINCHKKVLKVEKRKANQEPR
jgi:hypothetical protein